MDLCNCCLFIFKKRIRFLLFADVIMERMKVRREAQEAKRRAGEERQEAETGSVKTAEDTAEFTPQLDSGDHKDTESKASSQAKGELNVQYFVNSLILSYTPFLLKCLLSRRPSNTASVVFPFVQSEVLFLYCMELCQ